MLNLKEIRKQNSITQTALSKLLGIDQTTYSGYETGKSSPDINTLIRIADYFDVSLDYLCGRQNKNLIFADSLSDKKKELIGMIKDLNDDETLIAIGFVAKLANKPINEVVRKIKGDIQ